MGVAKKQRTIDYFQRQGAIEIASRVKEIVDSCNVKQAKQKKLEEKKN